MFLGGGFPDGGDVVRAVSEFVDANLDQRISLADMAAAAGLSRFALIREFRRRVGMTPMRFLSTRRVEAARRMLTETQLPLAQIAVECGFADQSHMTTAVKRVTGQTPCAIRRSMTLKLIACLMPATPQTASFLEFLVAALL